MKNKKIRILIYVLIGLVILIIILGVIVVLRKKLLQSSSGNKNKKVKKILIVGDSQSAIETENGSKITYTYPNILREKLASKGITIDVLALGGKTTQWMKENLPSKLTNNKYDRVIIYGGGNDTSNASIPLKTTLNNIQEMVNMANENGADVYVNLGYLVQGDFGNYKIMPLTIYLKKREDWIPYVEKRKELQRLIPKKIKNAKFIPKYDLKNLTKDGIHPTQEGHKIVAEKIYDSIING